MNIVLSSSIHHLLSAMPISVIVSSLFIRYVELHLAFGCREYYCLVIIDRERREKKSIFGFVRACF